MAVEMKDPLLLLVFNRLDTVKEVLKAIKKYKPEQFFIASDGPRTNKPAEKNVVEAIRSYILNEIDWKCEVFTLFRDENLGCGNAVSDAITWFFKHVEKGIILEDDCVPNESFFKFCNEILLKYEFNEKIMHISGSNFQLSEVSDDSYFYTYACQIWGWATWRRAWEKYDFHMKEYNYKWDFNGFVTDKFEKTYWRNQFNKVKSGKIDTWDYQWLFACWNNKGLGIMPRVNLVKNIGFTIDGTHTNDEHFIGDLKTYPLENIKHPSEIIRNLKADKWYADILSFRDLGPASRLIRKFDVLKAKYLPASK